jgi:ice-binding like protein
MNSIEKLLKPPMWILASLLSVIVAGCGGDNNNGSAATASADKPNSAGAGAGVGGLGKGPSPVELGAAANYVILAQSEITNVPTSAVTGNVGLSPATGAAIGIPCAEMTGVMNAVDSAGPLPCSVMDAVGLTAAVGAAGTAYTDAQGRAPDYTELAAGNIGGLNLSPATYKWSTAVSIPTTLTLTGGPNDVWIFQIGQGLTVSSGVQVILVGGALPQNVYWATFGVAQLGTTSKFNGVILSQTSIVMNTGATLDGRMFAGTAVTLEQNTVTQP